MSIYLGDYCLPAYSLSKAALGLYICYSASSEMKSMSILVRFSVLFTGMVGLHNAEEMDPHEACKKESRFQSGEEIGVFLPLGSCTIFLRVTSKHENDSFNCPVQESLFKCVEQVFPDFDAEAAVSSSVP